MKNKVKELLKQGEHGEEKFKQWLDNAGFSYLYIKQDPDSFAKLFASNIKRPDFLVLIDSIGILAVDIKNRKFNAKFDTCTLDKDSEVRQTIAFERIFRIPFWYAYLEEKDNTLAWHWISALSVVENGEPRSGKSGDFYVIKKKHFAKVMVAHDMGNLFSQTMPNLKNTSNLPMSK